MCFYSNFYLFAQTNRSALGAMICYFDLLSSILSYNKLSNFYTYKISKMFTNDPLGNH